MMQPMQSIMASTAIDRARGGKSGRAEAAKAAKDSINAGTLSTSPARAAVARRALTNFDPDATCVPYCMQAFTSNGVKFLRICANHYSREADRKSVGVVKRVS